jgi:hypothetical protein
MRIGIALLALAAMPSFAAAPLFDADDTVSFTLVAPFAKMLREKPGDYRDAEVIWTDANGKEVQIPARVKGRGFSRMKKDICQFPPLLLELAADKTPNTPFEGETLLPLSTHCTRLGTSNSKATSRLWLEYLVYRAFNAVSDSSFRARPLEITYIDADSAKRKATHPAFVIESFDGIAARLNGSVYRAPAAERTDLDAAQATRVEVFEYFAGNTDFSLIRGPEGEPCCHNVLLLQRAARLWAIPYDFDSTGVVDPPYEHGFIADLVDPKRSSGRRSMNSGRRARRCTHSFATTRASTKAIARRLSNIWTNSTRRSTIRSACSATSLRAALSGSETTGRR